MTPLPFDSVQARTVSDSDSIAVAGVSHDVAFLDSQAVRPSRHPHDPQVPRRARLAVEVLEDRTVPSTFLVTNTLDTGAGSLRNAIAQANATVGADTIAFDNTVFKVARTITLTGGQLS